MKLGLFTDPHYSSQEITCGNRYNSRSLKKMQQAYAYFKAQGCTLVICLGDVTDTEADHTLEKANLAAAGQVMRSAGIPTVCLMGNHDAFCFIPEDFYRELGLCPPQTLHIQGRTLLFLDACYFKNGTHYAPGDSDWTDTFYPHTDALQQQLNEARGEVYVFMHQNIDPEISADHRLHNADAVLDILARSGKVKAVWQGHYHPGHTGTYAGITLTALPAMCENEAAWAIFDI